MSKLRKIVRAKRQAKSKKRETYGLAVIGNSKAGKVLPALKGDQRRKRTGQEEI